MASSDSQHNLTPLSTQTALENSPAGPASASSAVEEIDLAALAQKVYRLLKQELRIERERLGRTRRF